MIISLSFYPSLLTSNYSSMILLYTLFFSTLSFLKSFSALFSFLFYSLFPSMILFYSLFFSFLFFSTLSFLHDPSLLCFLFFSTLSFLLYSLFHHCPLSSASGSISMSIQYFIGRENRLQNAPGWKKICVIFGKESARV